VVDRVGVLAYPVFELFVAERIGRRCPLFAIRSQGGLGQDALGLANPVTRPTGLLRSGCVGL